MNHEPRLAAALPPAHSHDVVEPTTTSTGPPLPSPFAASKLAAQVCALETEVDGLLALCRAQQKELEELRDQKLWAENEARFLDQNFHYIRAKLDENISQAAEAQVLLDRKTMDHEALQQAHVLAKEQLQKLYREQADFQGRVEIGEHQLATRGRQMESLIALLRAKTHEACVRDIALKSCYSHLPSATEKETLSRLMNRSRKAIRPQLIDKLVHHMLEEVYGPPDMIGAGTDAGTNCVNPRDLVRNADAPVSYAEIQR